MLMIKWKIILSKNIYRIVFLDLFKLIIIKLVIMICKIYDSVNDSDCFTII